MATVRTKLRRNMIEVRDGEPGHRFQAIHDRTQRSRRKKNAGWRMLRISAAVLAFTIGVVLVFIPGPAIVFFLIAAGLVATESRLVARALDALELRGWKIFRWGKKYWRRLGWPARIAILSAGLACSASVAVLAYRFIRG